MNNISIENGWRFEEELTLQQECSLPKTLRGMFSQNSKNQTEERFHAETNWQWFIVDYQSISAKAEIVLRSKNVVI